MTMARTLVKLSAFQVNSLETLSYGNEAGTFTNARAALDWVFAVLYPNTQDSVDLPADLPASGNNIGDYRVVLDDGDGKAAGYRWEMREGEATPSWHKIHDMDWSSDAILSSFQDIAQELYVHKNGRMDLDAAGNPITGLYEGQTIYGGSTSGNLTLNANAGDGTDPQSGYVQSDNDIRPTSDNALDLGTASERFRDLFLAGAINDGSTTLSVADMDEAYLHAQVASGNPHGTGYDDLSDQLGTLTVDGDASGSVDLSTSGDKTLTITVEDDSHNHTVSTITDLNEGVFDEMSAILKDTASVTWAFNDTDNEIEATVELSSSSITDIDTPTVNHILAANDTGDAWLASTGAIALTDEITGSAVYDSNIGGWEISCYLPAFSILKVTELQVDNKTYAGATGNPTNIPAPNHGLATGETVRLFGDITGDYPVTRIDANNFTVAIDTPGSASGWYIPQGAHLQYDTASDKFRVAKEYEEIRLGELQGLTEDVLSIYVAKDGRTGGQTIKGGISASQSLILQSTDHATRGTVQTADSLTPVTTAAYSGGWTGTDLGSSSKKFNDLYMAGEGKGFRAENVGALPTPSGTSVGRMVFFDGSPWFDNGSEYVQAGGGGPLAVTSKSSDYTATDSDQLILCTSSLTITLPQCSSVDTGLVLRIKNTGIGTVTIDGHASELIDGETTYTMETRYHCLALCSDGTGWHII